MAKYVDIEPVVKRLTSVCLTDDCFGMGIQMGINHAMEIIGEARIVDAVEVVHGRWTAICNGYKWMFNCNLCNCYIEAEASRNYCPNCGAKMDEEVADGT